jgi:hypothetical protein
VHVHIFALGGVILDHHIFGVQKRLFPKHISRQFGCLFLLKRLLIYHAPLTGTIILQCGRFPVRTYRAYQFPLFYKSILYLCDTAVGLDGGFAVLNRYVVDNYICNLYNIFVFETGISHGTRLRFYQLGTGASLFFACSLSSPPPTCGTMQSPASMQPQKKLG